MRDTIWEPKLIHLRPSQLIFRLGQVKAVTPPRAVLLFPDSLQQMRADLQEAERRAEIPSGVGVWIMVTSCSLFCRGPRIWGANWFLIRAAVSAAAICSACSDANRGRVWNRDSGIGFSARLSTDGANGRWRRMGMWRRGQIAAGDPPSLSQICAR